MEENPRRGNWSCVSVSVDDSDPRYPGALCDRCGVQGTVARALRFGPGRLVLRYCSPCWPAVQMELEARQEEEYELWQEADRAWFELWERSPQGTVPSPPIQPVWNFASRTWYDVRVFLALVATLPSGDGATSAHLVEVAGEIREMADEMDGPIPPDVQDFLARHIGPSPEA
jgi:hypothetical protein